MISFEVLDLMVNASHNLMTKLPVDSVRLRHIGIVGKGVDLDMFLNSWNHTGYAGYLYGDR